MKLVLFVLIAAPVGYYAGFFLAMALFRLFYGYKPEPERKTPRSPGQGGW